MKFGVEIKKVRQDAFLSQQDFAKELGVSFSTVNRWEIGKTRPTYRAMKAIDLFCKKNQIPFDVSKLLNEED